MQLVHQKKLRALGLSINEDSLQVVHNFSNRVLSVFETELLSKGLDFCFFPTKLHLNNIRAEFERVYSELKRFFVTRDLLVLKQKLMSLYGRYVSTFFHLLLCTEDDNSCYRNVCKMSVVSFALAVVFIIMLSRVYEKNEKGIAYKKNENTD